MNRILLFAIAIATLTQSCERGTSKLKISSDQLVYDIDTIKTKGWYTQAKTAKYDVDEFVKQNGIKKEWIQKMTFADMEFNIISGNVLFSDYDSISAVAWVTGKDTVKVIEQQVFDATTFSTDKKHCVVKTNQTFDAAQYVSQGDVFIRVRFHAAHDNVPKGKIQAVPNVDVVSEVKKKFGL